MRMEMMTAVSVVVSMTMVGMLVSVVVMVVVVIMMVIVPVVMIVIVRMSGPVSMRVGMTVTAAERFFAAAERVETDAHLGRRDRSSPNRLSVEPPTANAERPQRRRDVLERNPERHQRTEEHVAGSAVERIEDEKTGHRYSGVPSIGTRSAFFSASNAGLDASRLSRSNGSVLLFRTLNHQSA